MSKYDKAGLAMIPSGYKASKVYSVIPNSTDGDFDFSRSGSATRVNKDGLIEVVGSNVPRLDYPFIDGVVQDTPSLLLEPSRTNLALYSEEFDNSWWVKVDATISANQIISPDGNQTADKITEGTNNNVHTFFKGSNLTQTSILSIFAKKGERNKIAIGNSSDAHYALFDLDLGIVIRSSIGTISEGKIEDYGNGWYRCSCLFTYAGANKSTGYAIANDADATTYTGDGISGLYVWGAQVEAGSYPTSYIPTSGSAVTRNAEVCNGAGTSADFNDSEGVLFAEMAFQNANIARAISISDGSFNNRILFYLSSGGTLSNYTFVGGVNQCNIGVNYDYTTNSKLAFKYKLNDCSVWINGFELGVDTSASVFPNGTLNELAFDANGAGADPFYGNCKQLITFKEALTDAELEELTSWVSFNEMATEQLYTIE